MSEITSTSDKYETELQENIYKQDDYRCVFSFIKMMKTLDQDAGYDF